MNIFKLMKYDVQIVHYISQWRKALKNRDKFEDSTAEYMLWQTRCMYYSSEYEALERNRSDVLKRMKTPKKK